MREPFVTEALPAGRKLRVLRLLPELDFGGVESRVVLQSRLHDRGRFELSVAAFHRGGAAAEAVRGADVPVHELHVSPSPRRPHATLGLLPLLRKLQPDIVHASIAEANLHGVLAARAAGVPVVIAEETGMPSHGRAAKLVYRAVYSLSDAVIGVTQAVCDYVSRVDRAPKHKVRLLYNCANPKYFPEPRLPPAPAVDGPPRILLVGRLVEVKNHALFLRAFAEAAAGTGASLDIAGEGPLAGTLAELARELGIAERVRFLGFRSDVGDLLRRAHAFALPSLNEGCSVSLIEAMASGVPADGSAVPGIREVMGDLADELTAPPRDHQAWVRLLKKCLALAPDARRAAAARGQDIAYDRFSPFKYIARLESTYRELWAARRGQT